MSCEHTEGFCLTCSRARQRQELLSVMMALHVPPSIRVWACTNSIDAAVDTFDFGDRNTDVVRELAIASAQVDGGFSAPLADVWAILEEDIQHAIVDAYLKESA